MNQPDPARGQEVFNLDRAHVFHSWSAQGLISPLPVQSGKGSYFWDFDGNKFLDFSSQLVFTNIGFQLLWLLSTQMRHEVMQQN